MNNRRRLEGLVTSDKMEKTVVIKTKRSFRHPLYGKVVEAKRKLVAHDELDAKIGDLVRIVESRPLSKTKRWVVEKIIVRPAKETK